MRFSKIVAGSLIAVLIMGVAGCRKEQTTTNQQSETITLTYYRMFDNEEVLKPLFQQFQTKYPYIRIRYKKFTDFDEYYDLILNELAEGEGPDLFSMPNTWIARNTKKLVPAPLTLITPAQADQVFVSAAVKDVVHYDSDGQRKLFGVPLTVDTLALYYNKDHFDDAIPERGTPAKTWEALKEDVFRLTKKDNSFERFFRAGIAMGRSDNIHRAVDIVYLLMLQYKADFYDSQYKTATFTRSVGTPPANPAAQALELYTSFALQSNKNYSWNKFIASETNPEKDLAPFVTGKVSMVISYSYAYQQIMDLIKTKRAAGIETISEKSVRTAPIPQVFDPEVSPDKRVAYASYFVESVARTSKHPDEAWLLLSFLGSKESLTHYEQKTRKPTSRRDLIEAQSKDPIYGVFVNQIGYAESFPIFDRALYDQVFKDAITDVINTNKADQAIRDAQRRINEKLPSTGFVPLPPPKSTQSQ